MLNPFPELLSLGLLAPTILRVVVGILFLRTGALKMKTSVPITIVTRGWGILEIILGILLVIGLWTQISAIALIILTTVSVVGTLKDSANKNTQLAYTALILAVLLALVFTGAGFLAFDLPL